MVDLKNDKLTRGTTNLEEGQTVPLPQLAGQYLLPQEASKQFGYVRGFFTQDKRKTGLLNMLRHLFLVNSM